jgi:hypothetical protein
VAEVARLLAADRDFAHAHQAELGVVRLRAVGRRPALRSIATRHRTPDQPRDEGLPSARRARRELTPRRDAIELLPEPRSAI